ncbi:Hypothetical_protein [Hexamita inflata]|uniref:Hypothetical_protein n=1 Tax=Hexamita inflata TaxID=28002 RepID=A0AA86NDE6_9EUKA|nr:Hypothetical protein HINF_LOCUS4639 [Hexamita inflata]
MNESANNLLTQLIRKIFNDPEIQTVKQISYINAMMIYTYYNYPEIEYQDKVTIVALEEKNIQINCIENSFNSGKITLTQGNQSDNVIKTNLKEMLFSIINDGTQNLYVNDPAWRECLLKLGDIYDHESSIYPEHELNCSSLLNYGPFVQSLQSHSILTLINKRSRLQLSNADMKSFIKSFNTLSVSQISNVISKHQLLLNSQQKTQFNKYLEAFAARVTFKALEPQSQFVIVTGTQINNLKLQTALKNLFQQKKVNYCFETGPVLVEGTTLFKESKFK